MNLDSSATSNSATDSLPLWLQKLRNFAEQTDGYISCDFELTEFGAAEAIDWFLGNREAGEQFRIFGKDGLLSFYGYWSYNGQPLEESPIVYLHGEGVANTVLTNGFEEFLALLALGEDSVGLVEYWGQAEQPCEGIAEFREWVEREFAIRPPDNPQALVEQARRAHPDLNEWINRFLEDDLQHYQSDIP